MNTKKFFIVTGLLLVAATIFFFTKYKILLASNIENCPQYNNYRVIVLKKNQKPNYNDLIVFRLKDSTSNYQYYMSRCSALPGDTVAIINGFVYLNSKKQTDNPHETFVFRAIYNNQQQKDFLLSNFKIIEINQTLSIIFIALNKSQIQSIIDQKIDIKPEIMPKNFRNSSIFPSSFRFDWNEYNWGPIMVPHKDWVVELNPKTFSLWKNTILQFEKQTVANNKNKITVNGKHQSTYKFSTNYYFVLNDDRWIIDDSRVWGPIPEYSIVGKIVYTF